MDTLHRLESAQGGPFRFKLGGATYRLPDPADLNLGVLMKILEFRYIPDPPRMEPWRHALLFGAWEAHYDLPPFVDANRLVYLVSRYADELTYDLAAHVNADLGTLWRSRRWRTLLQLIDHLPSHSWYNASVAGDEEHAKMLAESIAQREQDDDGPPKGPPIHTWTPEVAVLTDVVDAVRHVAYVVAASNGGKVSPPDPRPRPSTALEKAMERARYQKRQAQHESLVARLLPHKARS